MLNLYKDISIRGKDKKPYVKTIVHAGNKQFGFSGFGDVCVGVLINPKDVVAVPSCDVNKLRCSELYFFTEFKNESDMLDFNEDSIDVFELDYTNIKAEEYSELLKEINDIDYRDSDVDEMEKIQEKISLLHSKLNINTTNDVSFKQKLSIIQSRIKVD